MPMSPYLKQLRDVVGHALLLVPSVSVLPIDDEGRVLLGFHPDIDAWSTLGGTIEPGETPEDAARREVAEEAAVAVHLDGLIAVLGGPEHHTTYANGDEVAYVAAAYRATITGGEPTPDGDEVTALRWFASGDVADVHLSPAARGVLRHLGWL
ncbi:MAG TPA: NUDIX domain-containing protein [Acidimicrobiia bacterium]|jgi:ADP-ribose pyrophosphatase YjhB (NUDIX family)